MHTLKIKRTDFQVRVSSRCKESDSLDSVTAGDRGAREALGLHQKLKFGRRAAVSSGKRFNKAKDPGRGGGGGHLSELCFVAPRASAGAGAENPRRT